MMMIMVMKGVNEESERRGRKRMKVVENIHGATWMSDAIIELKLSQQVVNGIKK